MAARYLAPLARSFTRPFAAQRSLSAAGYRQLVQDVTKNLQPSFAEEGAFEKLPLPLRDYSGNNPDFYFNSSVEEATVAQRNASRYVAPSSRDAPLPSSPDAPLRLRDYSGANPDLYFNTSVEEATLATHQRHRAYGRSSAPTVGNP